MHLLSTPHLPTAPVRLAAIGAGWPYITNELESRGVEIVELTPDKRLPTPVQSHADLLLHHTGGEGAWFSGALKGPAARCMKAAGLQLTPLSKPLTDRYPGDVALCCFTLGEFLFANLQGIDTELLIYYQSLGKTLIHLNQGYAKCSCCVVDNHSIITSDPGVVVAMRPLNIDVLLISEGFIHLPGYCHGFIGGCSGLLAPDLLAFTGSIEQHPDADRIRKFCGERGVEILTLCDYAPLRDIGGILPLAEGRMN